jgi:hypothetical protein
MPKRASTGSDPEEDGVETPDEKRGLPERLLAWLALEWTGAVLAAVAALALVFRRAPPDGIPAVKVIGMGAILAPTWIGVGALMGVLALPAQRAGWMGREARRAYAWGVLGIGLLLAIGLARAALLIDFAAFLQVGTLSAGLYLLLLGWTWLVQKDTEEAGASETGPGEADSDEASSGKADTGKTGPSGA